MLEFELVLGPEVASGTMTLDLLYHCWGETNLESLTAHKDTSCALMPDRVRPHRGSGGLLPCGSLLGLSS